MNVMTNKERMSQIGEVMDKLVELNFFREKFGLKYQSATEFSFYGNKLYESINISFYMNEINIEANEYGVWNDPEEFEFTYDQVDSFIAKVKELINGL